MSAPLRATAAPTADTVRAATAEDADVLTGILAAAFHDDAVAAWIFPGPQRRAQILPAFFDVLFRMSLQAGGAYTTVGRDAVILTTPPSYLPDLSLEHRIHAAAGEYGDALEHVTRLQETRRPGTPHHYVAFIGNRPERRCAGLGAALLRHVLDQADRHSTPVYAEASSGAGRALALRNGFAVLPPAITIADGVTLQPMSRPARVL